jgi:hypothetical protein
MSDEATPESSATPPSPEAVSAAAEAAAVPKAPEPPAPDPEIEEIPEGDTFDRAYVERLRGEAAKHRTAKQDLMRHFDGYSDAERTRFLELAAKLQSSPEEALEEFRGVTNRLAAQLGKEPFMNEAPTPDPIPVSEPEPVDASTALTASDVERLVTERLEAERAAAAQQDEIKSTFAEAEALDDSYKDPTVKSYLFAVAQHNGTDLAGAHEIIQAQRQAAEDEAVERYRQSLREGGTPGHPPRLPTGDPATATKNQGPPKTLEEARARAEERFRATYGN